MNQYPAPATFAIADIEGFGTLTDLMQRQARDALYGWLSGALGPLWGRCVREDRGDAVLMLWPADVPRPVIVAAVLRLADTAPALPLRLRVALHAGDVYRDERGFVGGDLNETFRLNEAAVLKAALKNARGPVAYLVSEQIHRGIVRYGDPAIDLDAFHPVDVVAKETRVRAWLHVPGDDGRAARLAAGASRPSPPPPSGGVRIEGRDVTISNSEIAGRNIR
ncbi:adenylate/guanylate cyclase domain-containing protein [Actinomadura sp. BRA 177]|uniref:adenylate/guanylate cyclase domain-containing protein n=1 Tax=Actinomadura sp. BRA 177 TaxID=2745202 RepID=UPI001595AD56|nr:adenylate/guanylate cyclase domain-containing protein [Actinomadura sp. BRA 177]NVI89289.1 adenylate/guanylate cyclase domain-containing protein [Actinomadura sp. BRA 177]